MSVTYAILGVVAASSGGLFGAVANHPAVRIIVAGVFGLLALSMFDVFYVQMPVSIQSKLAGRKGAGDDLGAVGVKVRVIEVDVSVNEMGVPLDSFPSIFFSQFSSLRYLSTASMASEAQVMASLASD